MSSIAFDASRSLSTTPRSRSGKTTVQPGLVPHRLLTRRQRTNRPLHVKPFPLEVLPELQLERERAWRAVLSSAEREAYEWLPPSAKLDVGASAKLGDLDKVVSLLAPPDSMNPSSHSEPLQYEAQPLDPSVPSTNFTVLCLR